MSIHKDNATGKWRVVYRYTDWTGETHQSSKRGFPTKREAQMWERELLLKKEAKLDMTFESFYEIYVEDMQNRIRDNTWVYRLDRRNAPVIQKRISYKTRSADVGTRAIAEERSQTGHDFRKLL